MQKGPSTIFFIGKPGSGKGTQAELLAGKTGWKMINAGDQFRAIAEEPTVVGRKVKDDLAQGLLAPHWFAMHLYLKSLFTIPDNESVIFDGFCRKPREAELIIDSLAWIGRPFVVLNIEVSDEEVRRRLMGRHRADDTENVIDERFEEFQEHTIKALDVFRKHGVLLDVNGEQAPEEVAREVEIALGLTALA